MEIVLSSIPDFSLTQTGIVLSISSSEYLASLTLLAKVYSTIWDWLRLEQFNQSYATKEEYLPGYWPKSRALHLYQKTKYKKLLNSLPIIPSSFIQQSKTHARLAKKTCSTYSSASRQSTSGQALLPVRPILSFPLAHESKSVLAANQIFFVTAAPVSVAVEAVWNNVTWFIWNQ